MPVSAEKARSVEPWAAMVSTARSSYSRWSKARAGPQELPFTNADGSTRARTPPGLTLAWARSMKLEASPALPWPAGAPLARSRV